LFGGDGIGEEEGAVLVCGARKPLWLAGREGAARGSEVQEVVADSAGVGAIVRRESDFCARGFRDGVQDIDNFRAVRNSVGELRASVDRDIFEIVAKSRGAFRMTIDDRANRKSEDEIPRDLAAEFLFVGDAGIKSFEEGNGAANIFQNRGGVDAEGEDHAGIIASVAEDTPGRPRASAIFPATVAARVLVASGRP